MFIRWKASSIAVTVKEALPIILASPQPCKIPLGSAKATDLDSIYLSSASESVRLRIEMWFILLARGCSCICYRARGPKEKEEEEMNRF